jgi:hypothetical protein
MRPPNIVAVKAETTRGAADARDLEFGYDGV